MMTEHTYSHWHAYKHKHVTVQSVCCTLPTIRVPCPHAMEHQSSKLQDLCTKEHAYTYELCPACTYVEIYAEADSNTL